MQKRPQIHKTSRPRVRFAPSPTGHLHVGGARTALFNWLFARKSEGVFVLRIEDTDVERSTEDSAAAIVEGLRWLGLDWDEGPEVDGPHGPYRQSQRQVLYRAEAERLVRAGRAYPCFCSREDLERQRAAGATEYDGRCGRLDAQEAAERVAGGAAHVVRFRMPRPGTFAWKDLVCGDLTFQAEVLDDFVLLKSDGHPTYNFAAVVDDAKMRITHVIRGDDHVSNTPRQLALYDALEFARPEFAHLPMIVGADRTRLSKRHGATSLTAFRDMGILPQAMLNYLALLGWALDGEHELFTRDELITHFDLKGVSRTPAVFDVQKLVWMNGEHFARLSLGAKVAALLPVMRREGLWPPAFRVELAPGPHLRVVRGSADDKIAGTIAPLGDEEWEKESPSLAEELPRLRLILEAVGTRLRGPVNVREALGYFYSDALAYDPEAVRKRLSGEVVPGLLRKLADTLEALPQWTPEALETALRGLAEALGVKAAALIHPARVALTGQGVSPGIFDVFYLLGRAKSVERLRVGADIAERNRELPAREAPHPAAGSPREGTAEPDGHGPGDDTPPAAPPGRDDALPRA